MKVNIKGEKYKVKYVEEIDSDSSILGQCRYLDKEILVKKRENGLSVCETIVHELMHAFINECGVQEFFDEEKLCYWFEGQFDNFLTAFIEMHNYIYPNNKIKLKRN